MKREHKQVEEYWENGVWETWIEYPDGRVEHRRFTADCATRRTVSESATFTPGELAELARLLPAGWAETPPDQQTAIAYLRQAYRGRAIPATVDKWLEVNDLAVR